MNPLLLHEFHQSLGAQFTELNGAEVVGDYGDLQAEHAALYESAGVLDLSFRSRICLLGADRARFLHGQVTNDVQRLAIGQGCYAAITTAKGKLESDLNIYCLAEELLLDFEPGLTEKISQRLERFIVADEVQIVDAAPHYGLLSVQGPQAEEVILAMGLIGRDALPRVQADRLVGPAVNISDSTLGEIYLVHQTRLPRSAGILPAGSSADFPVTGRQDASTPGLGGFDLFVPNNSLGAVADKLVAAAKQMGGRAVGWQAFETARVEAGIPRFGADMDETNLPLECGIESRAIVYNKGCYVGQEIINRIHSVGHVNRELRGLRLADDLKSLPKRGDKLFHADKEFGYVTTAVKSRSLNANIALGYVRREANQIGTELTLRAEAGESTVRVVRVPFGGA